MKVKEIPMLTIDQLRDYPLFTGLTEQELGLLLPRLTKRAFAKGVYLFYPGSSSTNTYLVASGLVRLFFTNTHGEEFLLHLVRPTDVFGLPVLDGEDVRVVGAATYQDSVVLSIECQYLLQSMQTMPILARNLYREASSSARMLLIHARALTTLNLNARLAFFLLRISHVWEAADLIELPLSQAELAGWLGASRGRLNRAISELQKQGLIRVVDARILLTDRAGLERLAQAGTSNTML